MKSVLRWLDYVYVRIRAVYGKNGDPVGGRSEGLMVLWEAATFGFFVINILSILYGRDFTTEHMQEIAACWLVLTSHGLCIMFFGATLIQEGSINTNFSGKGAQSTEV